MTPEDAAEMLCFKNMRMHGLESIFGVWQTAAEINPENQDVFSPDSVYHDFGFYGTSGFCPSLREQFQKAVHDVMACRLTDDPANVKVIRRLQKKRCIVDYIGLPVDKIDLTRLAIMNCLHDEALTEGLADMAQLLGYPNFATRVPDQPEGRLVLCLHYGFGGGVNRARLPGVVEKIWKPLGLVPVKTPRDLHEKNVMMASTAFEGAGFYHLTAAEGVGKNDNRPIVYINLDHPGITHKARELVACYTARRLDSPVREAEWAPLGLNM